MTSGSWKSIVSYCFKPHILLFFTFSTILVWGCNKEIYEFIGNRFWYTGMITCFIEFLAYLIGAFTFYKKLPSIRESIAILLIIIALLVANSEHT